MVAFKCPPAAGQLLPSARTADLSEDGEIFDSADDDDDDLPSVKQILASSKRVKPVVDLTGDDDDDREGDDGDFIETASKSPTNSGPLSRPSLPKSPAHTADDLITSSTAATPGRKEHPWVNLPPWSKLYHKLQRHSDKPLSNPTGDALHAGTDSPRSPSIKFEPALMDSRAPVTERVESSLEIPETPDVALEKIQREDSHSEDSEEHHGGSTQTVVGASMIAGDADLKVDGASSFVHIRPHNEHDTGSVKADDLQGAGRTAPVVNTPVFDEAPLSTAESSEQTLASVTVSASSLPDIGEDDPVTIDISCFTVAKTLDKRSSPFGVDSDELYAGMESNDDLSSTIGTETLAPRDLVPPDFDNAPRARSEDQQIKIFAYRRYLKVERSATLRKGAKVSKIWSSGTTFGPIPEVI